MAPRDRAARWSGCARAADSGGEHRSMRIRAIRTRGAQTRGPREIEDFVGWEMARGKGPPRSGDATGRIRGPHEACFVGWIGARGPVGLFGRTSKAHPDKTVVGNGW